ncbi:MAG: RNA polymerase sigma-70 factor [Runella sp.]
MASLSKNSNNESADVPAENSYGVTDAELFIQHTFAQNSEQGFTLLFRRYHAVLCHHAIRYVWSKEVAQDIVSDVFFNFWKNQEHSNINTSYRAYLFKAVRNGCYNYLTRELARRAPLEGHEEFEQTSPCPDHIIQFDELQHKIETAIAQLPPQCKRVFLLNRFEGKKYSEIAEEVGISIKTVEMHISKALFQLRQALKDEWAWAILFLISTPY